MAVPGFRDEALPAELMRLLKRSRKSEESGGVTHRGMGAYAGKFAIKKNDKHLFYTLLYNAIAEGKEVCLIEVHKPFGPVVVDIDLKYRPSEPGVAERRYTLDMVHELITLYREVIARYYELPPRQLEVLVMEKAAPTLQNGMCKDGVHLMFPELCLSNDMQKLLRKKVLRRLQDENIFEGVKAENSLEDILDEAVIESNGWMVYGCKKLGGLKYIISHIYDVHMKPIDRKQYLARIEEEYSVNLIQYLSIRKFSEEDIAVPKLGITKEMIETEMYTYGVKNQEREVRATAKKRDPTALSVDERVRAETGNAAIARQLVRMLSSERAHNYRDWIQLGMCLHSISETLVDLWDEFSQQDPEKYKEGECYKLWNTFRRKELKMGTLFYWAKKDSPAEYKKFKQEQNKRSIDAVLYNPSETRMAELIYHMYKDFYVCVPTANDRWNWYEFNGLLWKDQGTMGRNLMLRVEKDMQMMFETELRRLLNRKDAAKNAAEAVASSNMDSDAEHDPNAALEESKFEAEATHCERYIKNLQKVILPSLGKHHYLKLVIHHSGYHFHDEHFLNKLDKKLHLICFSNGVYDLQQGIFREGLYEDYLSMCTGIEYRPREQIPEYYDAVYSMLRENHPNEEDFQYLLKLYASCLQGNREEESFHILKGKGANGKTIETTLLKAAFGDYYANISSSLLTQKRAASSSAQPDLLRLKGKRVVVAEEPDKHEQLNTGMMKELTGGGTLTARTLYSAQMVSFDCNFVLFLCTNTYPAIHTTDGGTWRRIKVIEYPCKYVLNEQELQPNNSLVKRGDPNLKSKVRSEEYAMGLMSLLIDYYQEFKRRGLYPPPNVRAASEEYQKQSNMYLSFVKDMLEQTDDEQDRIHMKELFGAFREWYLDACGKKVSVNRNEFAECIRKELGVQDNSQVVVGFRRRTVEYESKELM